MSALRGSHTQGSAIEDAQREEVEARARLDATTHATIVVGYKANLVEAMAAEWKREHDAYAEAVRRTERVRAEALANAAERMNAILWRKDLIGFDYTAEYEDAAKQLQAALAAYRESQS